MSRPLALRCWLCVALSLALVLALAARTGVAEEPRKLALLALIDNDSGDTLSGDLAETAGRLVTGSLGLTGKYQEVRLLVGRDATKDKFFRALNRLIQQDCVIDIILETHGNPELLAIHGGKLTGEDIRDRLYLKGGEKIRLVYMMGCFSGSLVDDWVAVGADAVTGFVGLNVIPVLHYPTFLRHWVSGTNARKATERAYASARKRARSGWYRELGRVFQDFKVTEKDIDEGSQPVFAGTAITIDQIPTRADEARWLADQGSDIEDWDAAIDRAFDKSFGALDRESLRDMVRRAR